MIIPKSYLTTPMPRSTPKMGRIYDIEDKHMTHTNDDLKSQLFKSYDVALINSVKEYIEEIIPDWVKSNSYVVVAGGCFASRLQQEKVKDIDIFVLGNSSPVEENRMHEAIRQKMKISFKNIKDNTLDYVRDNDAVSEVWTDTNSRIQFVFTHHQTRADLIKDFDYIHCMTSYYLRRLYITRQIYDAAVNKHLIVNNNKNVAEWRRNKFIQRGYKDMAKFVPEPTLGDILAGVLKSGVKKYA